MGKWPDFEYHVGKWFKYDRFGYNSSHPSHSPKLVIFKHVAKDRQGFPRSKGDPRDGWDELQPDRSYLNHFSTWYSKSGHFPIEIPINSHLKRKWLVSYCLWVYNFFGGLWPYPTYKHGLPKRLSEIPTLRQNGTPYWSFSIQNVIC